jgi:hypothetical protein
MNSVRSRVALTAVAAVIMADCAAARLLFSADEDRVYFLGRALGSACGFRERFGLPCPTCGLTRSMVLTLHGEATRALKVAWGGPFLLLALAATAAGLLIAAVTRIPAKPLVKALGFVGAAAVLVWLAGWAIQFRAALQR